LLNIYLHGFLYLNNALSYSKVVQQQQQQGTMSRNHNGKIADEIGRIIFYRGNFLGRGRFATVFRGKYEGTLA